jgi:uncharacterized protein (TIGR00725 family)
VTTQVAVVGSGACAEGSGDWRLAEEVGRLLAEAGATVVCGGRGGVMEAVARGAAAAGGTIVGVLPGADPKEANPHCTHVVATGMGQARNLAVVASAGATIAIGGAWGTLSEIAHARNLGRPVIVLDGWSLSGPGAMDGAPGVVTAGGAAEAVAMALGPQDRTGGP